MFESVQHLNGYRIGGAHSGLLKVISCFAIAHHIPLCSLIFVAVRGDYSVLRQPCQSVIACLKSGKFAAGKATQVLIERFRKVLCSHECGFLDVRLVKDSGLLHDPNGCLVKGCLLYTSDAADEEDSVD